MVGQSEQGGPDEEFEADECAHRVARQRDPRMIGQASAALRSPGCMAIGSKVIEESASRSAASLTTSCAPFEMPPVEMTSSASLSRTRSSSCCGRRDERRLGIDAEATQPGVQRHGVRVVDPGGRVSGDLITRAHDEHARETEHRKLVHPTRGGHAEWAGVSKVPALSTV
ncbi:hypothetical protein [Brevibacterium linens]|uniref:hypothetical protein n=1 Tax=Brevibacterium linens TaxID=1703 RepID=UPI000FD180CC|nr:hypothetical protein [Brevibacterium linens]AZU00683.1 hypothetical protein CXR29_08165 [Brevibacterium linens]